MTSKKGKCIVISWTERVLVFIFTMGQRIFIIKSYKYYLKNSEVKIYIMTSRNIVTLTQEKYQ